MSTINQLRRDSEYAILRRYRNNNNQRPVLRYCCTAFLCRNIASSILFLLPAGAIADALPDHDNGPLTGIFGFLESTDGGDIADRGEYDWTTTLNVSSHSIVEIRGGESLILDGETTRLAFNYRHGISQRFDIGFEVPYLWHESGSLDSAIDQWHKIFGLPDGGRDTRQRDQLEFAYSSAGGAGIGLTTNSRGVGDIRLLAGWQISKTEKRQSALQLGLKLPTGKSDMLLGSGGTDVSLGIAVDTTSLWGNTNLSGFYRANVTHLGKPDWLVNRYKNIVGQLAFGMAYRLNRSVDLRLQSRIRSAVYDSATENLGDPSMSLTFGADFSVADDYRLSLSVAEDVLPGTAPDVSFQIALRSARSK